jgi:hypothetical protein
MARPLVSNISFVSGIRMPFEVDHRREPALVPDLDHPARLIY